MIFPLFFFQVMAKQLCGKREPQKWDYQLKTRLYADEDEYQGCSKITINVTRKNRNFCKDNLFNLFPGDKLPEFIRENIPTESGQSQIVRDVKIEWCGKITNYTIYFETFNIYEDGKLYCVGIVFSMEDI